MKRFVIASLALAVIVAAVAPASAAARSYRGGLTDTGATAGTVYNRYYNPAFARLSPSGSSSCSSSVSRIGWDAALGACALKYFTPATGNLTPGYQGYTEDMTNDNGIDGQDRCVVFDNQQGSGATRTGYYFYDCKAVTTTSTSQWNAANCSGTQTAGCVGQGTASSSVGRELSSTRLGTISPVGGLRPIPVPKVSGVNKATGAIDLTWDAAAAGSAARSISYDLYRATSTTAAVPDPAAFQLVGNFAGTSATVTVNPAEQVAHFFAIKLVYPPADTLPVSSLFFGAASAGVSFTPTAGTVTNITAKAVGGQGIAVSWNTSLEDGLRGFYVTRSFTQGGTYERVSGLIAAKGQASAYTYIDSNVPAGAVRATGVFYKVETIDIDDASQAYGPAKADLSGVGRGTVTGKGQLRKKTTR